MNVATSFALTALTLGASLAARADGSSEIALADAMRGSWESITCELRPTPYQEGTAPTPFHLTRAFTYDGNLFAGTIVSYADPLCEMPLVSYSFEGHLVSHGDSPAAPGAELIDYVLDRSLKLTPLNDGFTEQLNALPPAACGAEPWETGVEQSVAETGCALLNLAKGQVYVDHDIVHVIDDMLFFGAKPVDGSNFEDPANRPVQLQVPMIRVDG